MATKPLSWGILATGWIAELFTADLQLAGLTVAAVGSRTQEGADRFAEKFKIPKAHGSYEALVADPSVDIIYVATPHPMHAANAKLALENGKHVMIEKPFTLNAREAQEVVQLAMDKNLVVLEAMWTRFLPHMVRLRQVLATGVLGDLRSVTADHTQDLSDDPLHRINAPELGGGALLDLAIYPISFVWDIFNRPSTIEVAAKFKRTGVDGQVATLFGYPGGEVAMTLSSSDTAGPNVAAIMGTEGRIELDSVWYAPTSFRVINAAGTVIETFKSEVTGRGMQYQAIEMERIIRSGQLIGDILPPTETIAIMQCLDTIRAKIGLKYPGEVSAAP
jgi:predicted dehydrogenase